MLRILTTIAAFAAASPALAVNVTWIDWTGSSNTNGFTATGEITIGTEVIDVTYNNPLGVSFIQTGTGTNYFTGDPSPYTSVGPNGNSNVPTAAEMIALRFAGTQTLSFSKTVEDLYLSFVSLNGNGYRFSQDFEILSVSGQNIDGAGTDGRGFWGTGNVTRIDNGDGTFSLNNLTSGEPHGTLFFDDSFDTLTWDSLSNENWNGFTVGVEGLAAPVPVPASLPLLLAGLGGAACFARRSRKTRS